MPQDTRTTCELPDDAKLSAEIEVYKADHGWCALDSDQYAKDEAERAHSRLLALFKTALA
jgi:carboxymethylenebutenolidase